MKIKMPKSIHRVETTGKFQIILQSKTTKKLITVGTYEKLEDAVIARDKFIVENYNGVTRGYMPRGICKKGDRFQANFSFQSKQTYIGVFDTINEAINARNTFIESLK